MTARDYWEHRYGEAAEAHSDQNRRISDDFMAEARGLDGAAWGAIAAARSVVEFGCGTGEFIAALHAAMAFDRAVGADLSGHAVTVAREFFGATGVEYVQRDVSLPFDGEPFDLAVCSNTLEHFAHPWPVLNGMLVAAPRALVLVPYDQPCTDGYDHEGGAGHVYRFTEDSFDDREYVVDWFLFRSSGWQHSSEGETPLQMAALVERCP